MALCLANSLVTHRDFIPYDQLVRYKWWYKHGYMSSTGHCFDIGAATSNSLREFERRQRKFATEHQIRPERLDHLPDPHILDQFNVFCSEEGVAGNGALMRLAPVPLFFHKYPAHAVLFSGLSGIITHGDRKAYDACRYYGALIVAALQNETKNELLHEEFYSKHESWFNNDPLTPEVMKIAKGSYKRPKGYDAGIRGKGYIVNALEAALWALWSDNGFFETGALNAVNLGDDTDTTAAIYGQLAGALYGFKNLPLKWVKHVYAHSFISCLSKWITYEGQFWQPEQSILNTRLPDYLSNLNVVIVSQSIKEPTEDSTLTPKEKSASSFEKPPTDEPSKKGKSNYPGKGSTKTTTETRSRRASARPTSATELSQSGANKSAKTPVQNVSHSEHGLHKEPQRTPKKSKQNPDPNSPRKS
ncbi:unnamed protein product [Rotaria sp. Silwood2]|nr:unnamed protein product [Rotaria sp. Silwood2]